MKAQHRKEAKGNTLVMMVTLFLFVTFMIGMVMMVYNQYLGGHKQATTAIDAAALQAAKDMTLITVDGPLGKIGLVDNPAPTGNKYPVIGVNTLVGTLRLDALIASQLGNKNILYLVAQDSARAVTAINQLRQRIELSRTGQAGAFDRDGNAVNIKKNAQDTYTANAVRLGNKKSGDASTTIDIQIGTMTVDSSTGQTNIPTPSQPGSAATDADINGSNSYIANGMRFYKPNVNIAMPGLSGMNIRLLSLADSVSLIDKAYFSQVTGAGSGTDLSTAMSQLPSCVQVTANEQVNSIVSPGGTPVNKAVQVISTATAGGQRMTAATGTLAVSFPQGFPGNPAAAANDSTPLTFNSVKSIMNAVQYSDAKAATPSVDATDESQTWNGGAKGVWLKANGSNFPSSGSLDKLNFKGLPGRDSDNPSVSLSFMVYDWLRSMGLRPNPKSVIDALSFDLKTYVNGNSQPKSFPITQGASYLEPVYAQEQQLPGILTAIMVLNDGNGDPRDLTRWSQDPSAYSRQEVRMWGYIPADPVLPTGASVALITPEGDVKTTDGNPIKDLTDFENSLSTTNNFAFETNLAVVKALAQLCNQNLGTNISIEHPEQMSDGDKTKLQGPEGAAFAKKIGEKYPGLDSAWRNAAYCMQVTDSIQKNLKTLTGGGVKRISSDHFVVMGTDFYPAMRAATEKEVLASLASTGQNSKAPVRNWCAPMTKGADGNLVSQLVFYKRTDSPVIGKREGHPGWLPPALAQGSIPANNMLKFMFHLGDPNTPQASVVILHPSPTSPFSNVPTGNKQAEYQCTQAIKVKSTSDPNVEVIWQARARDQHCNHYEQGGANDTSAPNPNSAAKHFTAYQLPEHRKEGFSLIPPAMAGPNYSDQWCAPDNTQGCQALASEWAMTCPVVQKPPPPPSPTPPPAPPVYYPPPWSPPPPPPCWTTSYFRVEPPWAAPGTIYALLYVSCRYYNGCGQLINATHS
ncbi:MAG: hypothetical protein K2Y22_01080 [Candidatus Obscuribacterales bacterium]|nr:hypothetical protein [Candidatus Obscuribacterales bacterium]